MRKNNNLIWIKLLQSILTVPLFIGLTCKASQAANATLPVAPTPQNFMWQTLQEQFLDEAGGQCSQKIALAVSDHATCYAAPGGNLRCNGSIYTQQYDFATSTGITNIDQIMLSATFNAADGNGICVHKTDGTAWCMGSGVSANSWGQFGTGTAGAGYAQFVQWGGRQDIERIGTGTWDQMCALTTSGEVYCSGYSFGASPVLEGTGTSFYVTTFGTVDINPPVDRASPGRTMCTISGGTLNCPGQTFSSTSPVVDGGPRQCNFRNNPQCRFSPMGDVCLLNSEGTVQCFGVQSGQYFGTGEVLALATNFYTSRICAVKRDGSIWCADSGPGSESEVQPSGSVTTACITPIDTAKALVQQLPLNAGQKNSLTVKLNANCGSLTAAGNELNALVNSGLLTTRDVAPLLGELQAIKGSLGCSH